MFDRFMKNLKDLSAVKVYLIQKENIWMNDFKFVLHRRTGRKSLRFAVTNTSDFPRTAPSRTCRSFGSQVIASVRSW